MTMFGVDVTLTLDIGPDTDESTNVPFGFAGSGPGVTELHDHRQPDPAVE